MALFSYSRETPTSDRDTVRMLIQDTDDSVLTGHRDDWSFFLTDGEIDRLLSLSGNSVYRAAARACLVMASIDLTRNKAVRLGQFSTSNEAAEYWRSLSNNYLQQASIDSEPVIAAVASEEFGEADLWLYKVMRGESN